MSFESFERDNLDKYLKEVCKAYKKRAGKQMNAEIVLVGGAAIVVNYGFRAMTMDMDAVINGASVMKDAINAVADEYGLPNGWLNDDFIKTASYTRKLREISEYYRTYSNVVEIRTVKGAYLIAMKLKAARQYKYDLSDVVGILAEHERNGNPISIEDVQSAYKELYGEEQLSPFSQAFIEKVFAEGNFEKQYSKIRAEEERTKDNLIEFNDKYPETLNKDNFDDILVKLKKSKQVIDGTPKE